MLNSHFKRTGPKVKITDLLTWSYNYRNNVICKLQDYFTFIAKLRQNVLNKEVI